MVKTLAIDGILMTREEVLRKIRQLGITARYSTEWREYVINFPRLHPLRTDCSDYHTDDHNDAYYTALYMVSYANTK